MAKVLLGPAIAAASGSIGGAVFSHNRYGTYIRRRATPTTSTTADALAAKARLTQVSQAWQALTAAQKLAWKAWAEVNTVIDTLGNAQVLAANAAYIMLNTRLTQAAETNLTDPPVSAAPAPLATLVLSADIGAGTFDITFTPTPPAASERLRIFAAVIDSPAVNYVENYLRLVGISNAAQASPIDIQTVVEAKYGTLQVGQTVHVKVDVLDNATGLVSAPIIDSAVVVST